MSLIRFTLLALAVLTPALVHATEPRVALVIGNSAYSSGPLPNPANDARLMAAAFKNAGFDVKTQIDADQNTMKRAIEDFGARLEAAGANAVGLFFYAGHGVQLNGRNFLIPTRANIERAGDVEIEAVSADWVLAQMRNAQNSLNIVILDACRNNPFMRSMRSLDHGLANMDAPTGTLIEFSTAPGEVAADGSGQNSPYSKSLAQALKERNPVEQVFKRVRKDVMTETAGKQVPWEQSSLIGDFYFAAPSKDDLVPATAPTAAPVPNTVMAKAPAPSKTEGASLSAWLSGLFSTKPAAHAASEPTPAIPGARALALLKTLGVHASGLDADHAYPQPQIRRLIESAPREVTVGSTPREIREAYALCQKYARGCQLSDYVDEGLRTVKLAPFELDPLPVSVAEFRAFASAYDYTTQAEKVHYAFALLPAPTKVPGGSWRNGVRRRPTDDSTVVAVSFQDARTYCEAKGARLPTEDEWEYVARGPTREIFPWGDSVVTEARSLKLAPHVTDGPDEGIGRRYKGLSGGVWQWVDTSVNANVEPECAHSKQGVCKVLKGGSWLEENPAYKRAATRRYELPERGYDDSGFRCARPVPAWPDATIWLAKLQ